MCSGVWQGSVLGLILYLLYVNDIGCIGVSANVLMFADDTALICNGNDPVEVSARLETDLNAVKDHLATASLKLNVTKIRIIHFYKNWRKHKVQRLMDIKVDGQPVDIVNEFRYLGVLIDSSLRFNKQIEANIKKGNQKLYLFDTEFIYEVLELEPCTTI